MTLPQESNWDDWLPFITRVIRTKDHGTVLDDRVVECLSACPQNLTYYSELQAKGILPGFVGSNTRVGARIASGERVDEQRVDARLPDQHLVGGVW